MTSVGVVELPVAQGREPRGRAATAVLVTVGLFTALSITCAVTSDGFLEADSCTHYLYARLTLREPIRENLHHLVNVWGRPLCTGLYAIPAAIGQRLGVRIMSCLLALVCGLAAMRVAKLQGYRWPALALIFTLAQPLVFLHSFSELTELPFAAVIILGFWAYRVRQFWLMALLVGISPTGRPEGFGFMALAAAALVLHRKWYWLPLLFVPLALWNYAGWELHGRQGVWWQWVKNNWPYAQESLYPPGPWYHFLVRLPVVSSPLMFPAMIIGAGWSLVYAAPRRFFGDHLQRCQACIALIPLGILIGHSLLYALGKMASNGELRYLLAVAPFWGLLSAKGWEWVFERLEWRRPLAWSGAAALAPILVNVAYPVVPLAYMDDWKQARQIAAWLAEPQVREKYPVLMLSHPAIFYFMDSGPGASADGVEWMESTLIEAPPGTLMVWDPIYGVFNSDASRSITLEEIQAAGWVPRELPDEIEGDWRIFVRPQR
ncbi:MAG TPA: hypothetical protein VGR35_19685 [Tepidisphaeraceae bacterium]|nr:hypothetical protein [Tepidisphaeraceae bacterium]